MKVCLLAFGEKTQNGRVYSIESFTTPIPKESWVCLDSSSSALDLSNISGKITNIRTENGKLVGDVEFLPTPMGNIVQAIPDVFDYTPVGIGKVDENGTVSDYTMEYINMYQKEIM